MVKKQILSLLVFLSTCFSSSALDTLVRDTLDLDKTFVSGPASLIRGKVSGVRVSSYDGSINGADNVVIRGLSSLHGGADNQPLWIVDGVEVNNAIQQNLDAFWQYGESSYTAPTGQLSFLNAYDIESIEVLKDIASTSIYGSKGASGVIIVRTKKPTAGEPVVKWTSNIGVGVPAFSSEYFVPGISHNHSVSVNGSRGNNIFGVSAFYRDMRGAVKGTGSRYGGARLNFDAVSNNVVKFGVNAAVSMGKMSNTSGSAYLGQSSFSLSLREASAFPGASAQGWKADYDDDIDELRTLVGAYLDLNFGHGFKWSNSVGVDLQDDKRYIWYGQRTPFGAEMKNAASIIGSFVFKEKFNSTLEYKRYFGVHSVNVMLGFEQNSLSTSFNTTNGVDFFNENLRAKGLNIHRDITKLRKLNGALNSLSAILETEYSVNDVFGIKANLRPDFISRYLDTPRWYYSASAFFDIRKTFFPASSAVSALKLRAGYGTSGKATQFPYTGEMEVEVGSEPYYECLVRLYSKEATLSLESSFMDARLSFSASLYNRATDDTYEMFLFGKKSGQLWIYSDRKEVFSRTAGISNKGIEMDLSGEPVRTPNVRWALSLNASVNKNELTDVCEADRFAGTIGTNTVANINIPGSPVGNFYGYNTQTAAYGVLAGAQSPFLTFGGVSTILKVYGFTLDITADWTCGRKLLNLGRMVAEQKAPYTITEKYIENADFLRLGRCSLSYDINLGKVRWIRSLRVILSAHNLFTASSYSGWNPDVDTFGFSGSKTGIDYGALFQTRTVTAGFNIAF